jgi:hypothetical protein
MRDSRALWDDRALAADMKGLPTTGAIAPVQAAAMPAVQANGNSTGAVAPASEALEELGHTADTVDIAPKPAISPVVPQPDPGIEQPAGDIGAAGAIGDNAAGATGDNAAAGDLARASRPGIGQIKSLDGARPRIAEHLADRLRDVKHIANPVARKKRWQYHHPVVRYHANAVPSNVGGRIPRQKRRTPTPIRDRIERPIVTPICASISCQEGANNVPYVPNVGVGSISDGTTADLAPHNRSVPVADVPSWGSFPNIGGTCGNTNISIRISSPGADGEVTQVAASVDAAGDGQCATNTNISIRINSPGDNGPVSQSAGAAGAASAAAAPQTGASADSRSHSVGARAPLLDLRISQRSVAGEAQARAKIRSSRPGAVQAQTRLSRSRSEATVRIRASSAAGSSRASATVDVSAATSVAARRTRQPSSRKESTSSPRPDRRAASEPQRSSVAGNGGSGFAVEALLIALLATLAASYIFVPPLRPVRLGAVPPLRLLRRWGPRR